jgi:mannosyltransferase
VKSDVSAATAREGAWGLPALALIALGTVLRFLALGQQSFWHDEIHSIVSVWGPDAGTLKEIVFNPHGALYLLLLDGWIRVFGTGEAPVRMLSALLGALALVLFHRVSLRLVARPVALTALALLALSPLHLWYSQEARNYALLFDLGLIAVAAFLDEVERRTPASFLIAIIATALACLANLSGFFLFAILGSYALIVGRRAGYAPRRFIIFLALSALILSPWMILGAQTTGPLHLGRPDAASGIPAVIGESPPGALSIPFAFFNFSLGLSLGPSVDDLKLQRAAALMPHLIYLIPAGLVFALALIRGLRASMRPGRALLVSWLVIPIVITAALSALNLKAANSRYAFLALAPYLLFLAIGIQSIQRRALRLSLLGALLLFSAWSDEQYFMNPHYRRPDARAAGALLTRESREGDVVIVYALDYPVRYYVPRTMTLLTPEPADFASENATERWLENHAGGARRIWIVQCEGWWVDREGRFLDVCRKTMTLQQAWPFTKLPVYLFVRSGGPESDPRGRERRP